VINSTLVRRTPLRSRARLRPRSERTAWIRRLDALWSDAIVQRAGYRCERSGVLSCNAPGGLHAHHIVNRRLLSFRWLISNGIALTFDWHVGRPDSAHRDPRGFILWLEEIFPDRFRSWWNDSRFHGMKPPTRMDEVKIARAIMAGVDWR
jgi:hypothetical protein